MDEPVTLINSFEVPPDAATHFIEAWQQARYYLETQPGYVDTALHRSLTPAAEYQFVNIARWQSAADFASAIQSPGFRAAAAGLAGDRPHAALYQVVRT